MAMNIKDAGSGGDSQDGFANLTWRAYDVTFDGSYPAGGYSFAPADTALTRFIAVFVSAPAGFTLEYDYTAQKIKAYRGAGHTHVENTAAAYTQNAVTASPGQITGIEVNNGSAAMNGVIARIFVIGQQ